MLFVTLKLLPTVLNWENQLPQLTDCVTLTSCKRPPRQLGIAWAVTGTHPRLAYSRINHNLTAKPGLAMVTCFCVVLCTRPMPSKHVTGLRNFQRPPCKYLGHCGIMEVKSLMKDPVCQQHLLSYWTFRYSYASMLSTAVAVPIDCLTKAPSQHSAAPKPLLLFPTNILRWRTLYSPLRAKLFPPFSQTAPRILAISCSSHPSHLLPISSWSCSLL